MAAAKFYADIDIDGNAIVNAQLQLAPTTGSFIGQICRNASFYPVIWNGSAWVAPSGGSTVYAWKQFRGRNIAGGWTDVTATSAKYLIASDAGVGIRMDTKSIANGVSLTHHVDTNVVQCRPNNVAYLASAYADARIPGNNSGSVAHYTDITLAVGKFLNFAPDYNYVIYIHPGTYKLETRLEIPAHISLYLSADAVINGEGTIALLDGSSIIGHGRISCVIETVGKVTIEADVLSHVVAQDNLKVRANVVENLICLSQGSSMFNIEIDVLEIGSVRTVYGYAPEQLSYGAANPQGINLPNNNKGFIGWCECVMALGKWECPFEQQCLMKPYGTKGAGEVGIDTINYVEAQKSRLLIRANKRITDSVWMLAIGTTVATVEDYVSTISTPHTYITGLYPSSNIDSPEHLTILRLSNQREVCDNGSGYQVAHNSALVLNNVNSKCLDSNVFTNSDSSQNSTPHCATKNCTLSAQYSANINTVNSANIRYSTNGTYGDVGRNGGTLINAQADIIVNTSHRWM